MLDWINIVDWSFFLSVHFLLGKKKKKKEEQEQLRKTQGDKMSELLTLYPHFFRTHFKYTLIWSPTHLISILQWITGSHIRYYRYYSGFMCSQAALLSTGEKKGLSFLHSSHLEVCYDYSCVTLQLSFVS